ncbi:MAG: aminotransferase class IV [Planctomycetales bacterium]|nr:aminotransferase class IV [Planctomycetales bacterium]
MRDSIACLNGQWVKQSQACLTPTDIGILYGAVAVERLRTYRGQILDLSAHIERLTNTCRFLGVSADWLTDISDQIQECSKRVYPSEQDHFVVALVTPGDSHQDRVNPTTLVHAAPLPIANLCQWYHHGQRVFTVTNQAIPAQCWSPQIKCRSRLNYYLASRELAARGMTPADTAVLRDSSGNLLETGHANLLLIERDRLVSPPLENILHGTSLARVVKAAQGIGIEVRWEDVSLARSLSATGMLLTGTAGLLWPASQLDARPYANCTNQFVYHELRARLIEDLGFDFYSETTTRAQK